MENSSKQKILATHIKLEGYIDSETAIDFENSLHSLLLKGKKVVLLDCRMIKFISDAGIGALISVAKSFQEKQRCLVYYNFNEEVQKLLDFLNIQEEVHFATDHKHALQIAASCAQHFHLTLTMAESKNNMKDVQQDFSEYDSENIDKQEQKDNQEHRQENTQNVFQKEMPSNNIESVPDAEKREQSNSEMKTTDSRLQEQEYEDSQEIDHSDKIETGNGSAEISEQDIATKIYLEDAKSNEWENSTHETDMADSAGSADNKKNSDTADDENDKDEIEDIDNVLDLEKELDLTQDIKKKIKQNTEQNIEKEIELEREREEKQTDTENNPSYNTEEIVDFEDIVADNEKFENDMARAGIWDKDYEPEEIPAQTQTDDVEEMVADFYEDDSAYTKFSSSESSRNLDISITSEEIEEQGVSAQVVECKNCGQLSKVFESGKYACPQCDKEFILDIQGKIRYT